MLTQEPDNPFQSPAISSHAVDVEPLPEAETDNLSLATVKATIRWILICGISAAPSWIIAGNETTAVYAGMATGVLIFVIGYTFLDVLTRKHPLRQRTDVKWTLAITYGTRIAISLLFPIGFFVDIFCGVFAVTIAGLIFESVSVDTPMMHFTSTLVTTLIQGCLLNFVLAGYGVIVFAFCSAVLASKSNRPQGSRAS